MSGIGMKIFDAHFHIIDPYHPLVSNHGYLPPAFTAENYLNRLKNLKLVGGAVVSGSFQAFDQEYLLDALQTLGDGYCGVANIPCDLSETELKRLDKGGVRAVRFNLVRGGSANVKYLEYLSTKLNREFGWHTELYLNSNNLPELLPTLKQLPAFSIDHLGLSKSGLPHLYQCVELGARVKATGFGRVDFDPLPVMKKIMEINPAALLFGTDLPSTRARVPFSEQDIQLILEHFTKDEQQLIFYKNGLDWYRGR